MLIKNHFPRDHRLYKIFNRNTLKLNSVAGVTCVALLSSIIAKYYQQEMQTDEVIAEIKTTVLLMVSGYKIYPLQG